MCGIAGFLSFSVDRRNDAMRSTLKRMTDSIVRRGPDSEGFFVDADRGVALGFRRLAIIDLSPNGNQPMTSSCGRFTIVFNGEIYNYQSLKCELQKVRGPDLSFTSTSDTEVLLTGFSTWGIEATIKKAIGMFAMAIYDREIQTLTLCRDRAGEKPLYYGLGKNSFLFGSELKALKAHESFQGVINRDVLNLYFRASCIPAPYSIYKDIFKLPPGSIATVDIAKMTVTDPVRYWNANQMAEDGLNQPFLGTESEAIDTLESLLKDAVMLQMHADVPLGAFLSGGVDSSTIVALMAAQSSNRIRTFTMGFSEAEYDESKEAAAVAQHLGTLHTEMHVSSKEAMDTIPLLPILYDEPFADSSQIPTYLVSRIARRDVTVSLSGDGGDELFGGYNRHTWGKTAWNMARQMPAPVRAGLAATLRMVPPSSWNQLFATLKPILPSKLQWTNSGEKLQKLSEILDSADPEGLYRKLTTHWHPSSGLVLNAQEPPTFSSNRAAWPKLEDFTMKMMFLDLVTYLPDDILTKVDRASMGMSLESRIPFLDHRVIEFAWKLPLDLKIRNGQTKYILRKVLYKYVPKDLIERPKMGFGVPIDHWIRGPLKDWAAALIEPGRLEKEGFLNFKLVKQKWEEHQSGKRNWQHHLWEVFMFQAWLEQNPAQ